MSYRTPSLTSQILNSIDFMIFKPNKRPTLTVTRTVIVKERPKDVILHTCLLTCGGWEWFVTIRRAQLRALFLSLMAFEKTKGGRKKRKTEIKKTGSRNKITSSKTPDVDIIQNTTRRDAHGIRVVTHSVRDQNESVRHDHLENVLDGVPNSERGFRELTQNGEGEKRRTTTFDPGPLFYCQKKLTPPPPCPRSRPALGSRSVSQPCTQ